MKSITAWWAYNNWSTINVKEFDVYRYLRQPTVLQLIYNCIYSSIQRYLYAGASFDYTAMNNNCNIIMTIADDLKRLKSY